MGMGHKCMNTSDHETCVCVCVCVCRGGGGRREEKKGNLNNWLTTKKKFGRELLCDHPSCLKIFVCERI